MPRWIRLFAALALAAVTVTACTQKPDDTPAPAASESQNAHPDGKLAVTFRMPADFAESSKVGLPMTVTQDFKARIIQLKNVDSTEAIMVVSYKLPQDFTGATDEALKAKIGEYDTAAGATAKGEPLLALANRHKGFVQQVEQPKDGKTLTYEATYLFFGDKLVQVVCQWDQKRVEIDGACRTVLRSLDIK